MEADEDDPDEEAAFFFAAAVLDAEDLAAVFAGEVFAEDLAAAVFAEDDFAVDLAAAAFSEEDPEEADLAEDVFVDAVFTAFAFFSAASFLCRSAALRFFGAFNRLLWVTPQATAILFS